MRPSTPQQARELIRTGAWTRPTAGMAPGYVQANLVILPGEYALDFLRFCTLNPKPCPVLAVTGRGGTEPGIAPGSDLRTDLPRYQLVRQSSREEVPDIRDVWNSGLVSFLLGCSFTFEAALLKAGVPVRHIETGTNVPMYKTNVPAKPSGPFKGPTVVTMRPLPGHLVSKAVRITSRFPGAHGEPLYVGEPAYLGIADIQCPDFGDPPDIRPGEVPVFWACGVTSQVALDEASLPFYITHSPGHMLITDLKDEDIST